MLACQNRSLFHHILLSRRSLDSKDTQLSINLAREVHWMIGTYNMLFLLFPPAYSGRHQVRFNSGPTGAVIPAELFAV